MIFWTDELFEERPGLSGKLPEKDGLAASQIHYAPSDRLADPPCDRGGSTPEAQNGQRHFKRARRRQRQIDHRGNGKNRPDPHRPTEGDEVCAAIAVLIA